VDDISGAFGLAARRVGISGGSFDVNLEDSANAPESDAVEHGAEP